MNLKGFLISLMSSNFSEYYSKSGRDESADLTLLAEGELVAAKYEEDSCWYRARVTNTADELVQVKLQTSLSSFNNVFLASVLVLDC